MELTYFLDFMSINDNYRKLDDLGTGLNFAIFETSGFKIEDKQIPDLRFKVIGF